MKKIILIIVLITLVISSFSNVLSVADDLLKYLLKNYSDDVAKSGMKISSKTLSRFISKYGDDFIKLSKNMESFLLMPQ
ncbi:hypothetical protein [Marinitoga aeolica]|uniref:Uncharacterized protein n=1 Tax=Marinitoga aeolica TaxID=2809031 RepID=A0ABY8PRG6_9BACT|nr:hypothetical protein [Marinitoga aeolica]WGS65205.1 hypothetical protein JRV97_01210 [Marinitoga aeolica]